MTELGVTVGVSVTGTVDKIVGLNVGLKVVAIFDVGASVDDDEGESVVIVAIDGAIEDTGATVGSIDVVIVGEDDDNDGVSVGTYDDSVGAKVDITDGLLLGSEVTTSFVGSKVGSKLDKILGSKVTTSGVA